ncbi:FtsX-like permease family protein, partial [uncultured Clostridium sp.]|uniref:FtsX-like permease family protein n=1 Tax=uncultured Clostridium sp. TaxID=59620 RepID=UPI00263721DB
MLLSLVKRNIKKSFKDYMIYFITLSLAAGIFYLFNSFVAQASVLDISENQIKSIGAIEIQFSYISIFVSIVLGILIIYANNFIIRKRKKEFGIYMTLGMSKFKISKILILETMIVGVASLIVGLGFGIIISQGMTFITASLLDAEIKSFIFIISGKAILKTIICFGIIFIFVGVFNVLAVINYKVLKLIYADKKNEKVVVKKSIYLLIIFIIGVVLNLASYYIALFKAEKMIMNVNVFTLVVIMLIIGSISILYGINGLLIYVKKANKKSYLKGINIFTVNQISSKTNSHIVKISIISAMVFISIASIATGVSIKKLQDKSIATNTSYDFQFIFHKIDENKNYDNEETVRPTDSEIYNELRKIDKDFLNQVNLVEYDVYSSGRVISGFNKNKSHQVMSISDYNNLRELRGEKKVELRADEVILTSNDPDIVNILNNELKKGITYNSDIGKLNVKNSKVSEESYKLGTGTGYTNYLTVIAPDKLIKEMNGKNFKETWTVGNIKDKNKSEEMQNKIDMFISNHHDDNIRILGCSKNNLIESKNVSDMQLVYICFYIGIVFLISSAALISLTQLVEASESKEKYKTLRKLSVSEKMIRKSIIKEIIMNFSIPIIVAVINSVIVLIFVQSLIVN